MNERATEIYDAVIVGGGPAGTSAAIRLAMSGARVLLAEQTKFPRAKLCGEFISPECLGHFAELGVIESIMTAGGVEIAETVFYTRSGRSASVPSKWFGAGGAAVALGLSRAEMDARLLARARGLGVEVLEETQAVGLLIEDGRVRGVSLKTNDGQVRERLSHVTIDATGRARSLARRIEMNAGAASSGIRRRTRARLVAFKAHLEGAHAIPGHCEIYSYRGGYGGLNGVEGGLSNLCFIAAARDVKRCGGDAERVMREVVRQNKRAAAALKDARVASQWLCVALEGFGRSVLVPAEGLMTVGDAASFIDPFTGTGMLMALESGEVAATAIARWLPELRAGSSFESLAGDYRARYGEKFNARLRACAMLRRAAFVPRLNEIAIFALGASTRVRRQVTRATHPTVPLA